ncbi:MAG: hypothetical protein HYZ28_28195 [Myxococcales bacterium]|nr:hypothetical protein [Myxococcales bacterium]
MEKQKKKAKKLKATDALHAAALSLRKAEVQQLRFDPLVAKAACREGLDAVSPHFGQLLQGHPAFNLEELKSLPELCDRVLIARRAVQKAEASGGSATEALSTAADWRRKLLPLAQALAEAGAVSSREVTRIFAGRGPSDMAQDVVDLVLLLGPFRPMANRLHGKEALDQAKAAGMRALQVLGVSRGETKEGREAADLRDRYGTLVWRWHDRLRATAAAVEGYRNAALLVPSLLEGRPTSEKKSSAEKSSAEEKPADD